MDFFKFTANPQTDLTEGAAFRGYTSALWVERYRQPGEFEFVAPLSSGIRDVLPKGTIISHMDTLEACVVENHSIKEGKAKDPTIKISGRSLDAYLENRIVGIELAYNDPTSPAPSYILAAATTAQQAKQLINDHIVIANITAAGGDVNNSLDDNIVAEAITGADSALEREMKRQDVHSAVVELLNVADLGIRVLRKNSFGGMGSATQTQFYIHEGTDQSTKVVFSWDQGEIQDADYLSSLKSLKNVAHVQGRYVEEIVYGSANNFDRRVLLVDANDIDGDMDTVPSGATTPTEAQVRAKMYTRGQEAIAAQKEIDIVSIDISSANPYTYRVDYDIGDIVSVSGNYDATVQRRVVEHVESEDDDGAKSYPTLAVIES